MNGHRGGVQDDVREEEGEDWYHTGHVLDLDMSRLEALGESSPY